MYYLWVHYLVMKYLTLDCETTTFANGNPFSERNKLCYVGLLTHKGEYLDFPIEYGEQPYGTNLKQIQTIIDDHDCIIGFNLKFDLHWLLRYGITGSLHRCFDTQLVEFILSRQSIPYPSLNNTALSYGLSGKLDVVKLEYWDKGIDTPNIPEGTLREYLKQDVIQTWEVFNKQQERITPENKGIISLANQDLLTLLEIEHNGMKYNTTESKRLGDKIQEQLNLIDYEMKQFLNCQEFKPSSNDHLSAALYGGILKYPGIETYTFTYKDGRTKEKTRNCVIERVMPRLIDPLKGSQLAKEGYYATNEPTLRSLRSRGPVKHFIGLVLKRSELEKRRGTYLHGIPEMIKEMDWEENMIHGQLNQCVAITGRLSSSKPNLQNFDKEIADLFITRY